MSRIELENITLGEWLPLWFSTYKKDTLAKNSKRNIEQMIRLHTPEWLKALKISEITVFDIDRALFETPLGRTRVYVRQVWHNAFEKAQKVGAVQNNVVSLTDNVVYKKKKSKPLTIKEQSEFLQRLENSRYKWLFLFYIMTGVRRNEALSLEWKDIDKDDKTIYIKGTKTEESERKIVLRQDIQEILDGQKGQLKKEKIKGEFVFPYAPETISRNFKKLCPTHHLHDLRHTFATRCAECGIDIKVCQQVLGHSTADMTINTYTHVLDEHKRKEIAKFTLTPNYDV